MDIGNSVDGCLSCTIRLIPTTLIYPSRVSVINRNVTATVIPYITTYPNGTRITHNSTFLTYKTDASSHVPWATVSTTDLTWEEFGTILYGYQHTYIFSNHC
jgi:hypothetical protein